MLTDEQKERRRGKLTASRVAVLMTGDAAGILRLYQELRGEVLPEDLSNEWAVQLGSVTEELQLDWYERKNRIPVTRRGEVVTHPEIDWAACTLDGFVEGDKPYAIEAKHCGGREPIDPVLVDRYQPQMQWTMFVTDTKTIALSIILGANEPVITDVDRDDEYVTEMVKRARQFMFFIRRGEPPVALDPVPPPAADAKRIYDMTGKNEWADQATSWLETREAAKRNADAAQILKHMVPEDAKKCVGHGIQITRDRATRLSLREVSE